MGKRLFFILGLLSFSVSVFAQQTRGIVETPEMQVLAEDVFLVQHVDSNGEKKGFDLYVRRKSRIKSVMLVETTKDPGGKEPNYAYRAGEWNAVNGDEIRYLNGQELHSEAAKYSLISSTAVRHEKLGECFHIYIPEILHYGYPWSRNGTVQIGKGTFINIRTFEKPYGDYTGRFMDNAFMFDFGKVPPKKPEPPVEPEVILTDDYNSVAAEKFAEIARDGMLYYSRPEKLTEDLLSAVDGITPHAKADVVFAIDTTGSMKDDMEMLRNEWVPKLLEQVKEFEDMRLGLLFYRDYNDSYNYKGLPVKFFDFTRNTSQFVKNLDTVFIRGNEGGDIPEAVYEALWSGLTFYEWRDDAARKIILIGDAEPHPKPRGPKKISQEKVMELAKKKSVTLDCIIVPDEKAKK